MRHSEALSSDQIFVSRAQGLLGLLPQPLAYTPPTQLQQPSPMGMCCLSLTGYAATRPDCFPSPSPGFSTRVLLGPSMFSVQPDKDLATSSQGSQSGLPTRLLLSPHAGRLLNSPSLASCLSGSNGSGHGCSPWSGLSPVSAPTPAPFSSL